MLKLLYIIIISFSLNSCALLSSKGTRWPSSFYKVDSRCESIQSDLCKKKLTKKSDLEDNLYLIKSGQFTDTPLSIKKTN